MRSNEDEKAMIYSGRSKLRQKKCRNPECGQKFMPQRMGQHVCSPLCGLSIKDVNQDKAKKALQAVERKEHLEAKAKVKRKADHAKEAQTEFNKWIRLRDKHLGCVSCDKPASWSGQWHASHFKSVGSSPALRFEPMNCHKSCSVCNNYLSGNIGPFRVELIKRIGQEAVDWLEGPHKPKRYTVEDYQAIKVKYRALALELLKESE